MEPPIVGIDLGTTYSCVAVFQNGKVEIIANEQGNVTTPSYVAFTDTERLIGEVARDQMVRNPENTVYDAKRIIGRQFSDAAVQQGMKLWPFTVINDRGSPVIRVEYKGERRQFTPEEISAMVLAKMRETAETYLGQKVTDAVVTVPAYFNNHQRGATMDAGRIAGLNIKRIINEPTAAALAYGLDKKPSGTRVVLVFDLGGGTFDVSILKISDGSKFEVLSTAGDTHLGGQDFDNRVVNHFAREFRREHQKDLSGSARAMRKLKAASEEAKRTLSSSTHARIEVDSLYEGIYYSSTISRARFEKMCDDLFRRTLEPVEQALRDAHMNKTRIDDVVMVGGSTRIPKVQQLVRDFFGGKELNMGINADEAVAYGAAIQAAMLSSDRSESVCAVALRDVIPLSIGIEVAGLHMEKFIERNTAIPASHSKLFSLGRDDQDAAGIKVLEGERVLSADNIIIGEFLFSGLVARRRDQPGIQVTFDINANGLLCVTAADAKTGKSMQQTFTESSGRLNSKDIERMVKEAEQFRAEDDALRERIAIRNQLESFVVTSRFSVLDAGENVSDEDRKIVFGAYDEVIDWLDMNSLAEKVELVYWLQHTREKIAPVLERLGLGVDTAQNQASGFSGDAADNESTSGSQS